MAEPEFDKKANAGRNIGLLALTQATGGSSQAIIMAVGALTAATLAPDPSLATVPTTAMIVGLALMAGPATRIIYKLGRKNGFLVGATLGFVAGLLAALAVSMSSFYIFAAALCVVGLGGAFTQQYRFAIADSVPDDSKARAISLVLLGGVAAGFLGPRLSYIAKDWIAGAEYAGSFLIITVLSVVAMGLLSQTKLAPIVKPKEGDKKGRSALQLAKEPEIFIPIITGMVSYALMTFVMVAAPLAMVHICGHSPEQATTTIQWHIISMFAPSLFTGHLINRIGAHMTVGLGLMLILGCALINLNGITTWHFDAALILLGVGWNFGFIGSTTLLSQAYKPEEASTAQGLNEPFVFGSMAVASISSGVLLNTLGWQSINVLVLPLVTATLALLAWGEIRQRQLRAG